VGSVHWAVTRTSSVPVVGKSQIESLSQITWVNDLNLRAKSQIPQELQISNLQTTNLKSNLKSFFA